jgi:DNA (cytosine-5)-methyltransferase 1
MLRLQGFPDSFKIPLPYSQARKVAGNSVTVPVIEAIAGQIIKSLKKITSNKNIQNTIDFEYFQNIENV